MFAAPPHRIMMRAAIYPHSSTTQLHQRISYYHERLFKQLQGILHRLNGENCWPQPPMPTRRPPATALAGQQGRRTALPAAVGSLTEPATCRGEQPCRPFNSRHAQGRSRRLGLPCCWFGMASGFALVVRALFVRVRARSSRIVRALLARSSRVVRTLLACCSHAARTRSSHF